MQSKSVSVIHAFFAVDNYVTVHEADLLAPIFLRDDSSSSTPPISPAAKSHFLLYFMS